MYGFGEFNNPLAGSELAIREREPIPGFRDRYVSVNGDGPDEWLNLVRRSDYFGPDEALAVDLREMR